MHLKLKIFVSSIHGTYENLRLKMFSETGTTEPVKSKLQKHCDTKLLRNTKKSDGALLYYLVAEVGIQNTKNS